MPYGAKNQELFIEMRDYEIFVDSIANLTDEMIEKGKIKVVPYVINIDGKEMYAYQEGVSYEEIAKKFYEDMEAGACPRSSLINCDRMIEAVTPYLESGKDILFITCASNISGTYQQAVEAAKTVNEKYGETRMLTCDSANASLGEGLLAVKAAEMRDAGKNIADVKKWFDEARWHMNSVFTTSDLKYFRRSGRISATVAVAGNLLNLKPILIASGEGKIVVDETVRGRRKSISTIAEQFAEKVTEPENQTIAIAHCDCLEDAERLGSLLKDAGAKDIVYQMYDICSGTHIGPGGLALFFMGKDRRVPKEKKGILGGRFKRN